MTSSERKSALCAYRSVEPNPTTRRFLERVQVIADQVVGYQDSALVKAPVVHPQSRPEAAASDVYQGVGISAVDVYKEVDLKVVVFQRAAPRGMNLDPIYAQAHAVVSSPYTESRPRRQRFTEETDHVRTLWENPVQLMLRQVGLSLDISNEQQIRIKYTGIQENFVPGSQGREYALIPHPSAVTTDLLNLQSRKLFDAYGEAPDGEDVVWPAAPSVVNMPIYSMSCDVDAESSRKLLYRVQSECLGRPLIVPMGEVKFDYNT